MQPMLNKTDSVDWWFAFKFNGATYQTAESSEPAHAIFGGRPKKYSSKVCMQYAFASSKNQALTFGGNKSDIGTSLNDPLGATFNQIYNGKCSYVLWNDQYYGSPMANEDAPWGHSKGALAWDDQGNGMVLQVSTPSWPASGSVEHPRANDGNTLGCVKDDDVEVSQHFFALKLNKDDVTQVLKSLANSSVVTKPGAPQLMNLGPNCPADLAKLAGALGKESTSKTVLKATLSTGVTLISKPSGLHVPPWQMVSAELGSIPLRVASWWAEPEIPSTQAGQKYVCWDGSLAAPGAVDIATSGTWQKKPIGLMGGDGTTFNHAKIGVSQDKAHPFSIFGDMNQQGTLDGVAKEKVPCASSQNGRGGLFYVVNDAGLNKSISALLAGKSAPTTLPAQTSAAKKSTAKKKPAAKKTVAKKPAAKKPAAKKKTAAKKPAAKKSAAKKTAAKKKPAAKKTVAKKKPAAKKTAKKTTKKTTTKK